VVFCQQEINAVAAVSFFSQFCHLYNMYGFGSLTEFQRSSAFFFEPTELLPAKVDEFFKSRPLSEFQSCPILLFIIAPPIYDLSVAL